MAAAVLQSGRHLKAARVAAGLTQRELADAATLHVNSIKNWESRGGNIAGFAVSQMLLVLASRGISIEPASDGATAIVLRNH